MKNLTTLTAHGDVVDFVEGIWRTELFRDAPYIRKVVDNFAWVPRMFAETSNDYLERAHFSTWWNVILLRDYENPYIHDLYYLHEMTHATTMPYIPGIGRAAFDEKMQRNELEASVLSEIAVYLEIRGLRENSFHHPIYADRFLDDPDIMALWRGNKKAALETIRFMRRDVMVSKPDHLMDDTERWIRRFAEQNTAYAITWSDRYNDVETQMRTFQVEAALDRIGAIERYRGWLLAEAALDPIDNIPFRQESELFSPFYWANKAKYDEEFRR